MDAASLFNQNNGRSATQVDPFDFKRDWRLNQSLYDQCEALVNFREEEGWTLPALLSRIKRLQTSVIPSTIEQLWVYCIVKSVETRLTSIASWGETETLQVAEQALLESRGHGHNRESYTLANDQQRALVKYERRE